MDKNISFTLKVWRQKGPKAKGAFETYQMKDIDVYKRQIEYSLRVSVRDYGRGIPQGKLVEAVSKLNTCLLYTSRCV